MRKHALATHQLSTPPLVLADYPIPLRVPAALGQDLVAMQKAAAAGGKVLQRPGVATFQVPPAPGVSFDADFGAVGSTVIAGWFPSSTPGNVLIVGIYVIGGTAIAPTGWTLASLVTNGASNGYIFTKISAGETSVTITLSGPVQWTVFSGEFLPGSLAGIVDQAASDTGASAIADTGTTSPTTSPIELAIGLIGDGVASSPTIGGGFVVPLVWQSSDFVLATMGYRILTSVGPQEMTAAFTGPVSWAGCIATIM